MLHNIPNKLIGASLGDAHKWVRAQMTRDNPHRIVPDYKLTDENGKEISLGDLTKGTASHVTIHTKEGTIRSNPAHPADLAGFMEVPAPMHQIRLTALTQNEITPALYNSMVNEYGLFGATQILSILLTRPISPALRYPLKTSQLIKARTGESLIPAHRFIPPPTIVTSKGDKKQDNKNKRNQRGRSNPAGGFSTMSSSAVVFDSIEDMLEDSKSNPNSRQTREAIPSLGLGRNVLQADNALRISGVRTLGLNKRTEDIRRAVNNALDDVETAFENKESGALMSVANSFTLAHDNSKELFDNFAKNVMAPYLITSTANINALKYINEYVLPTMRLLIQESGRKSDANMRKLDASYRSLVDKLATDPKDFYMGKELALIAHPGFMRSIRAGFVLFPAPTDLGDSTFKVFQQLSRPITYDQNTGAIKVIDGAEEHIQYLDAIQQQELGTREFTTSRLSNRMMEIIDRVATITDPDNDVSQSKFNRLLADTQRFAAIESEVDQARALEGRKAFYFTDLPGLRPIPATWPQKFVLSAMEILGRHKDRITGLNGGRFSATEFLTPSGVNMALSTQFTPTYDTFAEFFTAIEEVLKREDGENNDAYKKRVNESPKALNILEEIQPKLEGVAYGRIFKEEDAAVFRLDDVRVANRNSAKQLQKAIDRGELKRALEVLQRKQNQLRSFGIDTDVTRIIRPRERSNSPSVYEIIVEAVELSELKYRYAPTDDDIKFMVVLIYYCLQNMNIDDEEEPAEDLPGAIRDIVREDNSELILALQNQIMDLEGELAERSLPALHEERIGLMAAQELVNNDEPEEPRERFSMTDEVLAGRQFEPPQLEDPFDATDDDTDDDDEDEYAALRGYNLTPSQESAALGAYFKARSLGSKESFGEWLTKYVQDNVRSNPNGMDPMDYTSERTKFLPLINEDQRQDINNALDERLVEIHQEIASRGPAAERVLKQVDEVILPGIMEDLKNQRAFKVEKAEFQTKTELIGSVEKMFKETTQALLDHLEAVKDLAIASRQFGKPERVEGELYKVQITSNNIKNISDFMNDLDGLLSLSSDALPAERNYVNQMKEFIRVIDDDLQFKDTSRLLESLAKETDLYGKFSPKLVELLIQEYLELDEVVQAFGRTNEVYDLYSRRYSAYGFNKPASVRFTNLTSSDQRLMQQRLKEIKFRISEILQKFFPRFTSGKSLDATIAVLRQDMNAVDRRALEDMLANNNEPFAFINYLRKGKIDHNNMTKEFLRFTIVTLDKIGDYDIVDATEVQKSMDKVLEEFFATDFNLQRQLFTDPGGLKEAVLDVRQDLSRLARRTRQRLSPLTTALRGASRTLKDRLNRGM